MYVKLGAAKLVKVMGLMRKYDREMPVHHVIALLYVASNEGCPVTDVVEALGVTSPTGTRVTTRLADGSASITGIGLLRIEINHKDRRFRCLFLTRAGRQLVNQVESILGEDHDPATR